MSCLHMQLVNSQFSSFFILSLVTLFLLILSKNPFFSLFFQTFLPTILATPQFSLLVLIFANCRCRCVLGLSVGTYSLFILTFVTNLSIQFSQLLKPKILESFFRSFSHITYLILEQNLLTISKIYSDFNYFSPSHFYNPDASNNFVYAWITALTI